MDNIQNGKLQYNIVNMYKFSFFYEFPQYWETSEPNDNIADVRAAAAAVLGRFVGNTNTFIECNSISDEEVKEVCDLLFRRSSPEAD